MLIKSARYIISSPSVEQCPKADKPEYAFIGRSNVGKSSLINMLCNQKGLAKISATPGKTQMINHFMVNESWYVVDLPGYGYAKRSLSERKLWDKMIQDYLRKRTTLVTIFILIDSRHAPQPIDLEFVNLLGKWQVPFSVVFTKSDKEKPGVVQRNVKAFIDALREDWEFLPQQFVTSSEKKIGRDEMLAFIDQCNKNVVHSRTV